MVRALQIIVLFLLFSCSEKKKATNIIYILADDLGYGEIGVYGQTIIETPHLDSLARGGLLFTQHYSGSPVCAPSRSVLLTGKHSGHTYIRGNDEWKERGDVWNYIKASSDDFLEGQRPIPDSVLTFAEVIQEHGYKTGQELGKKLKSLEEQWIQNNFVIDNKTVEKSLGKSNDN